MARRRASRQTRSTRGKRRKQRARRAGSPDTVVRAGVVLWGSLLEEVATYALATNRELIALGIGQADPRDAMLRLGDISQRYLARLANIPRRVSEELGIEFPDHAFSRQRQGHPRD